jgi:adenosylcobinamide-phosphate synthase
MTAMLITPHSVFYAPSLIVLLALLIDAVMGDPRWLYNRIPHPVVGIGKVVSMLDAALNITGPSNKGLFWRGMVATAVTVFVSGLFAIVITAICNGSLVGLLVLGIVASSFIAWRGLLDHVKNVAVGLENSLESGRRAISHIVGRDPDSLDEAAISRAAVESLSENFSDGTVAPIFWFCVLGFPGLVVYKSINTLDSMIGHHNTRYEYFGKASARLDDVVNFIPARVAGLLIVIAAFLSPNAQGRRAWQTMIRDAPLHKSINAGWQEAAMAGALDIALAGPRIYDGAEVVDHWMNGDGRRDIDTRDIIRALHLYKIAGGLLCLVLLLIAGGNTLIM